VIFYRQMIEVCPGAGPAQWSRHDALASGYDGQRAQLSGMV